MNTAAGVKMFSNRRLVPLLMTVPTTLPPITPDLLAEWIQPGTLTAAFIALFVSVVQGLKGDIRASEARLDKRIDAVETNLHKRIDTVEANLDKRIDEVREEIKEVRAEIKALESKLDPVLESLLAVKS